MSQHENFIGRRFQHNKRRTHYQVIGQFDEHLAARFADGEEAFFLLYDDGFQTFEVLIRPDQIEQRIDPTEKIFFKLQVGIQISNPTKRLGLVLIYQSLVDGKIWARYADEFTPDRFTEIV